MPPNATPPPERCGTDLVTDPALAWHLSGTATLQRMRALVERQCDRVDLDTEARQAMFELLAFVRDSQALFWQQAAERLATSPADLDRLLHNARPHINFSDEDGVPTVTWDDTDSTRDTDATYTIEGAVLIAPFRQVCLDKLPEGTRFEPVRDPLHLSQAIACEAWAMVRRDLAAARSTRNDADAWNAAKRITDFYAAAVGCALREIRADEFNLEGDSKVVSDEDIARTIAAAGRTLRAKQTVAIHLIGTVLSGLIESCQKISDREQALAKVERLLGAMSADARAALDHCNEALASDGTTCLVVIRPIPAQAPVVAIIPEQASPRVLDFSVRKPA